MFGNLLRKLGLNVVEAKVADTVLSEVADRVTGGVAGDVEEVIQNVSAKRKKRKR